VIVAACTALPGPARAQAVVEMQPSVTVAELFDSNLFATAGAPRADLITRLTPALGAVYRTPAMDLRGRYTFDAERYADLSALTRLDARQHAAITMDYEVTPRLSWQADAGMTRTRMPGELLEQTGVLLPRGNATRVSAQSSVTRHLGQRTDGHAEYTFTDDSIEAGVSIRSQAAALNVIRRRSLRTSTRIGYRLERYHFGPATLAAVETMTAQAVGVEWTRQLTGRISLSLGGGPRLSGSELTPDLSATLRALHDRTALSLGYQRTRMAVLGVARPVDVENVFAQARWELMPNLRARVMPAWFRSRTNGMAVDVYRMELGVEYPLAEAISIDASVAGNAQSGRLHPMLQDGSITRYVSSVQLIVRPPAVRPR
jgi:hypothetical protein